MKVYGAATNVLWVARGRVRTGFLLFQSSFSNILKRIWRGFVTKVQFERF
jgi:hypothetical protein